MSKGRFYCFITYFIVKGETHITDQFRISGKAEDENIILACGSTCSGLLQKLGIKHDVNFVFKPLEGDEKL